MSKPKVPFKIEGIRIENMDVLMQKIESMEKKIHALYSLISEDSEQGGASPPEKESIKLQKLSYLG